MVSERSKVRSPHIWRVCSSEILKKKLRGTKVLFCGLMAWFFFHPKRYQMKHNLKSVEWEISPVVFFWLNPLKGTRKAPGYQRWLNRLLTLQKVLLKESSPFQVSSTCLIMFQCFHFLAVSMKGTYTYYKTHKSIVLKMEIFNQYWTKINRYYNIAVFICMYQMCKRVIIIILSF